VIELVELIRLELEFVDELCELDDCELELVLIDVDVTASEMIFDETEISTRNVANMFNILCIKFND
jgi:hypothetical protein